MPNRLVRCAFLLPSAASATDSDGDDLPDARQLAGPRSLDPAACDIDGSGTFDWGAETDGNGVAACDEPGCCWKGDPAAFPEAAETGNGFADDGDGEVDVGREGHGDRAGPCALDGDDTDASVRADPPEPCGDGVDQDRDLDLDAGRPSGPGSVAELPPLSCVCEGAGGGGLSRGGGVPAGGDGGTPP
jgi:hypothetical protein